MKPLRTSHERREDDIYDYEYRLKSGLELLDRTKTIAVEDKALIKDFLAHLKANGVSTGRLAKYLFHLKNLGAHLGVTFKEAKRADIERLVSWLTDQDYTPHTVSDYAFALKRFYKFVRFGNVDPETPYPEEVRWVRRGLKASERTLPDFVTEEQIITLVSAADKLRDKAMLSVGYEGGFRASELLLMNVGDVTLDERGARVKVRGKTGERRVRLISSAPILGEYLDVHPLRDNPSAPLWLNESTNSCHRRLGWAGWDRQLKYIASKAKIKKRRFYNHLLRHGSATAAAKYLSDSQLKIRYGWSMGSRMPAVYVHLSGQDLDEKLEEIYAGRPIQLSKPQFAPIMCIRCGEPNTPGVRYCKKCGTPLIAEEIERTRVAVDEIERRLADMEGKVANYLSSDPKDEIRKKSGKSASKNSQSPSCEEPSTPLENTRDQSA
jgi:integrase/recombinase XerD